jgi:hypothetical protein
VIPYSQLQDCSFCGDVVECCPMCGGCRDCCDMFDYDLDDEDIDPDENTGSLE